MGALRSYGGVTGLASVLHTDSHHGLDPKATGPASIEAHKEAFGANKYRETPPKAFLVLVWENLQDPIIILLCAAALVRPRTLCCTFSAESHRSLTYKVLKQLLPLHASALCCVPRP
jgi:hypothetical protein